MEFYFPEIKIFLEILRAPTKYWPQGLNILNPALYSTNCYKTYENLKYTILKFSNVCKTNERKRGFGVEKRGEVSVETSTQIKGDQFRGIGF